MNLKTLAILTAVTLSGTAGISAFAADGEHDKAIKARQSMFQLYNFSTGILGDMAKGKIPYDAAAATEAATNLSAVANLGQSQFWPAGSDNATDGNARTRALPKIWTTFPAITEKADALKTAAADLVPAAGAGLESLQNAMGAVGDSCKGCHQEFRARRR
jgi:cytochrome c556